MAPIGEGSSLENYGVKIDGSKKALEPLAGKALRRD
jgi:hypothetical protein